MKMMIRYGLPVSRIYSRYFGGDMKVRCLIAILDEWLVMGSYFRWRIMERMFICI